MLQVSEKVKDNVFHSEPELSSQATAHVQENGQKSASEQVI